MSNERGHTLVATPVPVRSQKLSISGPDKYQFDFNWESPVLRSPFFIITIFCTTKTRTKQIDWSLWSMLQWRTWSTCILSNSIQSTQIQLFQIKFYTSNLQFKFYWKKVKKLYKICKSSQFSKDISKFLVQILREIKSKLY